MTEVHRPGSGAIFGIVTEDSVVKPNSPVFLLDARRHLGEGMLKLIGKRFTRQDGGFEFAGLNPLYSDYMVMATDEDGEVPKSPLAHDRVQPVFAHVGTAALGEWYVRMKRDGAVGGFMCWPVYNDGAGYSVPYGLTNRPIFPAATQPVIGTDEDAPTDFSELGRLGFNQSPMHMVGERCALPRENVVDAAWSVELVIDMDSIAAQLGDSWVIFGSKPAPRSMSSNATNPTHNRMFRFMTRHGVMPWAILQFKPNKTVDVVMGQGSTSNINLLDNLNFIQSGRNFTLTGFNLSSFSGNAHIVFTFTPGVSLVCYVNGEQHHQVNTTQQGSLLLNNDGMDQLGVTTEPYLGFLSSDNRTNTNTRDYGVLLAAFYNRTLSASQVLTHYRALYNRAALLPIYTGYAQKVTQDLPFMYWRLSDLKTDDVKLWFDSDISYVNPSTFEGATYKRLELKDATVNQLDMEPSPIAGRFAPEITDGYLSTGNHGAPHGWSFRDRGSLSFWLRAGRETLTEPESLISWGEYRLFNTPSTTTTSVDGLNSGATRTVDADYDPPIHDILRVSRTEYNHIKLLCREGSSYNEYVFEDYTIPHDEWIYVVLVIDKTGQFNEFDGVIHLYVGTQTEPVVLKETKVTNFQPLFTTYQILLIDPDAYVHKSPIPFLLGGDGFQGSIAEVALFPDVLIPERIEAHWLAKDVV